MLTKKKLKVIRFNSKKILFDECYKKVLKSKTFLISGGTTFDYFIKYFPQKIMPKKKLIMFDERITSIQKKRNYNKIKKIVIKKNIFNFEDVKKNITTNKLKILENKINTFPLPDLALIGIGNDGHIGSIFPTILKKTKNFLICKVNDENFNRISLNLSYIKKIKNIIFVINNKNKKNILKKLLSNKPDNKMPVFKLIKDARNKVFLYYLKNNI
jgi:6-phosphogluconolactonase/glucosamine-6-phosphate isomerase/deaminase